MAEQKNNSNQQEESRDVWTGGPDWGYIFSGWNLFMAVLIIFLLYLFLKKVLPVIRQSKLIN